MKRIPLLAVLVGLVGLLYAAPQPSDRTVSKRPAREALWVYLPFNGGIDPSYSAEGVRTSVNFSRRSEGVSTSGESVAPMEPVFEPGLRGKAIYIGGSVVNLLSREQSDLEGELRGISPVKNGRFVIANTAWHGKHSLAVEAVEDGQGVAIAGISTGPLVKPASTPGKPEAMDYIFSFYAQGEGSIQLIIAAEQPQDPGETIVVELTPKWKRYICGFTAQSPVEKLQVQCRSVKAAKWLMDGLMVESHPAPRRDIDEEVDDARAWIVGDASRDEESQRFGVTYNKKESRVEDGYKETGRDSDFLTATFNRPIPWDEGSISFWFRPDHERGGFLWEAGWLAMDLINIPKGLTLYVGQKDPTHSSLGASGRFDGPGVNATILWGAHWHHLVSAWDAQGHARQYVDGALVASSDAPSRPRQNLSCLSIGGSLGRQLQDARAAKGAICEFAIFKKLLSPEEIQALLEIGKAGGDLAKALGGDGGATGPSKTR